MGRIIVVFLGLGLISINSMAFSAKATFRAVSKGKVQIYVDGQLVNQKPKQHVRVRTLPGNYEVTFKVFDENGELSTECYEELRFNEGFNSNYKLDLLEGTQLEIRKTGMEKLYSKNYRSPHQFFNKRNIAKVSPAMVSKPSENMVLRKDESVS